MQVKSYFGPDGPPGHWELTSGARDDDDELSEEAKDVEKDEDEEGGGGRRKEDGEESSVTLQSRPKLSDFLPGACI